MVLARVRSRSFVGGGCRGYQRNARAPKRLPPKSNLFNRASLKPLIDTIGPKEPRDTRSRLPHVERSGCAGMTRGSTHLAMARVRDDERSNQLGALLQFRILPCA